MEPLVWDGISDSIRFNIKSDKLLPSLFTDRNLLTYGVELSIVGKYHPNDKKFYLLSGSYGTGKSHLCLMTANVLSRSSGDPEIAGFYENYDKLR